MVCTENPLRGLLKGKPNHYGQTTGGVISDKSGREEKREEREEGGRRRGERRERGSGERGGNGGAGREEGERALTF